MANRDYVKEIYKQLYRIANSLEKLEKKLLVEAKDDNPLTVDEPMTEK